MMKRLLLSCLILIASICVFSQTTSNITITSEQLRVANLIFAEHKKFSEQIPQLELKIHNLEELDRSWQRSDSIKNKELQFYKYELAESVKRVEKLDIKLSKQRTYTIVCGSVVVVTLLTLLLVK